MKGTSLSQTEINDLRRTLQSKKQVSHRRNPLQLVVEDVYCRVFPRRQSSLKVTRKSVASSRKVSNSGSFRLVDGNCNLSRDYEVPPSGGLKQIWTLNLQFTACHNKNMIRRVFRVPNVKFEIKLTPIPLCPQGKNEVRFKSMVHARVSHTMARDNVACRRHSIFKMNVFEGTSIYSKFDIT